MFAGVNTCAHQSVDLEWLNVSSLTTPTLLPRVAVNEYKTFTWDPRMSSTFRRRIKIDQTLGWARSMERMALEESQGGEKETRDLGKGGQ